MKKGREEKTKFSKILPNNQIIIACRIELRVQEMTMNKKLTMIGLIFIVALCKCEYQRLWTFARNLLLVNFKVLVLF